MSDPLVPPAHEKLSPFDSFVMGTEAGLGVAFSYAGFLSEDQPLNYSFLVPVRLMVALSGGPDSTALLAACIALKDKMGLELTACHVNHHTRGADSDHDEAFCTELCKTWGTPLLIRHMSGHTRERPSESTLRDLRYSLLADAANEAGARSIGLAHTLNDQIETILFRLFRGTGLAGLAGMEAARRLNPNAIIVRPLLAMSRADCVDYLRRLGVESREDASNSDLAYARNYIRHRIVPAIEERFPGFQERIDQLRQRVSAEETFLKGMADESFKEIKALPTYTLNAWDLAVFRTFPIAIQRRLIALALQQRGIEVAFQRVTAILEVIHDTAPPISRLSLNSRWDVSASGGLIRWIDKDAEESSILTPEMEYPVRMPGLTVIPLLGRALKIELWSPTPVAEPSFPAAGDWEALVDLSKVTLPLVVRGRRPGDQIRPFGMDNLVRLKKYLHNRKSPDLQERRPGPLCLLADQEEVLWVPGVGLSNKVRVTDRPSHRLSWVPLAPDEIYFS